MEPARVRFLARCLTEKKSPCSSNLLEPMGGGCCVASLPTSALTTTGLSISNRAPPEDPTPPWLVGWKGDGVIARIESRTMERAVLALGLPAIDLRGAFDLQMPLVETNERTTSKLAFDHQAPLNSLQKPPLTGIEVAAAGTNLFHVSLYHERRSGF
jgi:hypothetical protein